MGDNQPVEPKSFARRDLLIDIQKKAQERWDKEKPFEQDAPMPGSAEANQPKHFITFPYPYMNGLLHLGHTFSLTKNEFSMGFERLKGKKTLWPFGFHCTGKHNKNPPFLHADCMWSFRSRSGLYSAVGILS